MNRFVTAVLLAATAVPGAALAADTKGSLIAIETQFAAALVAGDLATIDSLIAPDWVGQNPSGTRATKAAMLAELKSGRMKYAAMTLREVDARIFGDIAVIQGADDEKSSYGKMDLSGAYTWTDVLQKRDGRWVIIASQGTPTMK